MDLCFTRSQRLGATSDDRNDGLVFYESLQHPKTFGLARTECTQSATIMSKLLTLFAIYARLTSASTAISANGRCHRLPSLEYPGTNGVTDMNNKENRSKIRRSFCHLRQSSASDHSSVPQKCCHSFAPQFTEIRYQCVRSYFAAAPGLPIHSTHCEHTSPPAN